MTDFEVSTAKVVGLAVLGSVLSVASVALVSLIPSDPLPEVAVQLIWLGTALLASLSCGYLHPDKSWRWGALVVGLQPLWVFLVLWVDGEIQSPSSSTGGMAAVLILIVLAAVLAPLAAMASRAAGEWRRRTR